MTRRTASRPGRIREFVADVAGVMGLFAFGICILFLGYGFNL